ncbi:hypothetical protein DYB32_005920 [Aphanomyces invadans]|uniref:AB hydrolase-1 domain-containing protein n=1 Tax=Aphanomyces invadans TaxID=157072 RepID=A0A3R6VXC6_9STRA|nr:hypothetical protein DYB32_005920 [Aphanomyces invadans]
MRASIVTVALAAVGAATAATLPPVNFSWYPCHLYTTEDANSTLVNPATGEDIDNPAAECADVVVPVCHPDVCVFANGTKSDITVFVKRMQANVITTPKKALWVLQGGPGHSSEAMEGLMSEAYAAANGTISVYTMDHRGVGRSTLLSCVDTKTESDLAACLGHIKATYAPAAFSVTSAATDLKRFVESSTFDDTDVFVYGVSYGTYLVERLMHLAPTTVKGYILDSIQSEQFYQCKSAPYYSNWDQDVGEIGMSYIGPDAKQTLIKLYKKLNNHHTMTECAEILRESAKQLGYTTPSDAASNTMYNWLGSRATRVFIPAYIYRVNRCNHDDAIWLRNVHPPAPIESPGQVAERGPYLNGTGMSDVVYSDIVFNEIWKSPSPTADELYQQSVDALISLGNVPASQSKIAAYCVFKGNADPVCDGHPTFNESFAYPRDAYWNKTAAIPRGASVLMFTGYLDPATPSKYAIDENKTMQGTQKLLLEFPFTNHGIMGNTPVEDRPHESCGSTILTSYLAANGDLNQVRAECIRNVEVLDFSKWSANVSMQLFGSESPYEDTTVQAQVAAVATEVVKSYGAQVVVLSALLAVAVIALVGMAVYVVQLKARTGGDAPAKATAAAEVEAATDGAAAAKETGKSDDVVVTV